MIRSVRAARGVRAAAERYREAGSVDVRTIIYPEMRHEILNEPRRRDVYVDVESWLTEQSAKASARRRARAQGRK